jgi:hypothetical protein
MPTRGGAIQQRRKKNFPVSSVPPCPPVVKMWTCAARNTPFVHLPGQSKNPPSLPRLLPLLAHRLPQSLVDARLVPSPTPLEPCQNVGVQPQRHRPLHRLVHAGPLLRQVARTPPARKRSRRRLDSRHSFGRSTRCLRTLRNPFMPLWLCHIVCTKIY